MSIFSNDPIQIIIFNSYGKNNKLRLQGRALEDENIRLESNNKFRLILNSWKRFESDEIKHCKLKIILPTKEEIYTVTDKDGYFSLREECSDLKPYTDREGFLKVKMSYAENPTESEILNDNSFFGDMLIPDDTAEYGVISDIDDTILDTGVVSLLKWKLLYNTFFRSPHKRKALEGTSAFYNKLHDGIAKDMRNPIFYVSHSPWNMYRYLELFLTKNKFPKGAILLRTMKSIFFKSKEDLPEKHQEIIRIIQTYNHLQFVLIGDAGEYDADIYIDVVTNFPDRIKAIFVRSVKHRKKMERIKTISTNFKEVPFFIVSTHQEAIDFARQSGLIA